MSLKIYDKPNILKSILKPQAMQNTPLSLPNCLQDVLRNTEPPPSTQKKHAYVFVPGSVGVVDAWWEPNEWALRSVCLFIQSYFNRVRSVQCLCE